MVCLYKKLWNKSYRLYLYWSIILICLSHAKIIICCLMICWYFRMPLCALNDNGTRKTKIRCGVGWGMAWWINLFNDVKIDAKVCISFYMNICEWNACPLNRLLNNLCLKCILHVYMSVNLALSRHDNCKESWSPYKLIFSKFYVLMLQISWYRGTLSNYKWLATSEIESS